MWHKTFDLSRTFLCLRSAQITSWQMKSHWIRPHKTFLDKPDKTAGGFDQNILIFDLTLASTYCIWDHHTEQAESTPIWHVRPSSLTHLLKKSLYLGNEVPHLMNSIWYIALVSSTTAITVSYKAFCMKVHPRNPPIAPTFGNPPEKLRALGEAAAGSPPSCCRVWRWVLQKGCSTQYILHGQVCIWKYFLI